MKARMVPISTARSYGMSFEAIHAQLFRPGQPPIYAALIRDLGYDPLSPIAALRTKPLAWT